MPTFYIFDRDDNQSPTLQAVDGKIPRHVVEMPGDNDNLGHALLKLHKEGADLTFLDLTKSRKELYDNVDWMGIQSLFKNQTKQMINLSGSRISEEIINNGDIRNINFNSCELIDISIFNSKMTNVGFDNTKVKNFNIKSSLFFNCSYRNANWTKSSVEDSSFQEYEKDDLLMQLKSVPVVNIYPEASEGFKNDFGIWKGKNNIDKSLHGLRYEKRVNSSSSLAMRYLKLTKFVDSGLSALGSNYSVEDSIKNLDDQVDGVLKNIVGHESSNKDLNSFIVKEVEGESKKKWGKVYKSLVKRSLDKAVDLTSSSKIKKIKENIKSQMDTQLLTKNKMIAKEIHSALMVINNNFEYLKENDIHIFLCNHRDVIEMIALMADCRWKMFKNTEDACILNEKNLGTLSPSVMAFTKDNNSHAIWMDSSGKATKIYQYNQEGVMIKAMDLINGKDILNDIKQNNDIPTRDKIFNEFNASLSDRFYQKYVNKMKSKQENAFLIPYNPETHFISFSHEIYKIINLETYECENPDGPCFLQTGLENKRCAIEINGQIEDKTIFEVVQYLSDKRKQYDEKYLTRLKI